jgi:PAS domain S-box-containing protein
LEANLTVALQLGIERSGLIKRPFHGHIVPADRDKFRSHLNEVVTSKKRQSCEIGLMTKSGGDFYALLDTLFILDSSGKKLCRSTATDITQRKRAENLVNVRLNLLEFAASHSSEELLQKTLDEIGQFTNSPIGFLHFVGSDQKTLSLQAWSTRTLEEFCSAEGKGAHYPIEKAGVWVDCFHEKSPVIHNDYSALPHRKGLPDGHPPVIRELLVPIMRSGRIVAILGIGNKPEDYTQQDIGVASYLADVAWEITQRKRVEEDLRENQSRLDLALRSAHMGVWRLDLIEKKRHFDDQVCHLLGMAQGKFTVTAEEFYKAVHPDDREMLKAVWARTIKQDVPYEAEYRAVWPDGSVHYVTARGKLVHDDKGQPVMVNGLIWDVTDRKQMEDELRRSRTELELRVRERTDELSATVTRLEQLNEELQEFAFIASHDLQEPLRKIQTFGNMLIKKHMDSLSSEGKDYMERVTKAANRMSELLQALLNYSRTGTSELNYKSVSLTKVAKDAASDLEYMIAQAKGTVEISELPTVDADPALLRQLFQNVIGNSIKYRKESEPPFVKIYGKIADATCQIMIEDNGIGFDERYRHKIFKPFERLHGKNTPYSGTGMGLAICKKIVNRHSGEITVMSVPKQGTTFIVILPIEQEKGA